MRPVLKSLFAILLMAYPVTAEEAPTMEVLEKLMNEVAVLEYWDCNVTSLPTVSLMASTKADHHGREPTTLDLATEAALGCNKLWLAIVDQLSSHGGYAKALKAGLELQAMMIEENVDRLRNLPRD